MAKHNSPMRLNEQLVKDAKIIGSTLSRTAAEQIKKFRELPDWVKNTIGNS
jgi:hypothetical protein